MGNAKRKTKGDMKSSIIGMLKGNTALLLVKTPHFTCNLMQKEKRKKQLSLTVKKLKFAVFTSYI